MRPFDTDGEFAGGAPQSGARLTRLAVRGAGITVLSSGLSLAIQIVATVVLARILVPRDFGLVAMVTTFSLLLSNFGINGITEAIVQQEKLDHFQSSNLFWMNLCVGMLLTCGFAAVGSVLAKFYAEPSGRQCCAWYRFVDWGDERFCCSSCPAETRYALLGARNQRHRCKASLGCDIDCAWLLRLGILGARCRRLRAPSQHNHWRVCPVPLDSRASALCNRHWLDDEVCNVSPTADSA